VNVVDGTIVRADELAGDGTEEVHIGGLFGWLPLRSVTPLEHGCRRLIVSFMQHLVRDDAPIRVRPRAAAANTPSPKSEGT
jgi:hypothetical protein